jgi:WD40 repeat protein/serine/threonine protein kinase
VTLATPNRPVVPDHELFCVVGRGAYGEVWLARNIMGTPRAVKIVRRSAFENSDPFEREFAGVRRYEPISRTSPGLVQVLHVGRDDAANLFYYVMELADPAEAPKEGAPPFDPATYQPRTLRSDLKRLGRRSVAECVEIGLSLAEGLGQLHAHHLVHRDVKPSNIIFVNGRAKLADLGLVGEMREGSTLVGTTGYISPEGPGRPAADLFALGKVLYEAATGMQLARFPETPGEWLGAGHEAEFELVEIILRLCSENPAGRHPGTAALRSELALLQGGQSIRRLRGLERRFRLLRRAAVIGGIIAALSLAGFWVNRREAKREHDNFLRSEGLRFDALVAQARASRMSSTPGRRAQALAAISQAATIRPGAAELRTEAIAALMLPELRSVRTWPTPDGGRVVGCFSDDLSQLARALPDGRIELIDPWERQPTRLLPGPGSPVIALEPFSFDQRWLLSVDADNEVFPLPVSGAPAPFHAPLEQIWCGREFTPDSRWLILSRTNHQLELLPLNGGPERRFIHLDFEADGLGPSPNGRLLAAYSTLSNIISVIDLETDRETARLRLPASSAVTMVVWSHDSKMVVAGGSDFQPHLWRLAYPDQPLNVLRRHDRQVEGLAFSLDDTWLVTAGSDRQTRIWNWATGELVSAFRGTGFSLRLAPDGRHLGWNRPGGWELLAFDLPVGWAMLSEPAPAVPDTDNNGPLDAAFSPDGRWIATASFEGVRLYDTATHREELECPLPGAKAVVFSPDGRTLHAASRSQAVQFRLHHAKDRLTAEAQPPVETGFIAAPVAAANGQIVLTADRFQLPYKTPSDPKGAVPDLAGIGLSPDGKFAAGEDLATNLVVRAVHGTAADLRLVAPTLDTQLGLSMHFAFSHRGPLLFRAYRHGAVAWNRATGRLVWEKVFDPAGDLGLLALSGDDQTLALALTTERVLLLDPATGAVRAVLEPPDTPRITSLAFDGTGRRLAATCATHVTHLWDLASLRAELRPLGLDW